MKVFLINEEAPSAKSLIKKLSQAKNGQMIPLTEEEFETYQWDCASIEIQDTVPSGYCFLLGALTELIEQKTEVSFSELKDLVETARRMSPA